MSKMICPRCWGSKFEPPKGDRNCTYCFGDGVKDDVRLSPHLLLSECLRSQTAVRKNIPNDPSDAIVEALRECAAKVFEPIRARFGATKVNSGYRSSDLNVAIGGSKSSIHCRGQALDLDPLDEKVRHRDVMDWIVASNIQYDQLIYEGTWIHVGLYSMSGAVRRENLMMFPDSKGRSVYFKYDPHDARVSL